MIGVPDPLLGRDATRRQLTGMLDIVERRVPQSSSSAMQVGKSALLSATAADADARGFAVLTTRSVPSETHLPFAASFPVVEPILPSPTDFRRSARRHLGALGYTEVDGTDPSFLALATLNLFREHAVDAPLLVVVKDAALARPAVGRRCWVRRSPDPARSDRDPRLEPDPHSAAR